MLGCVLSQRWTSPQQIHRLSRDIRLSNLVNFDLKERVRSAIDIVDVVGASLELHPKGRNFVAICPWHSDRRPSLTVNRERQTWKCWPCDIGGDIFNFVMRRDGVDFPGALRLLAEQAGIPIEEYSRGKKQTVAGSPDDKATLLSAMKLITKVYFDLLAEPNTDDARIAIDYLDSRGVDDENRQRFQIGFAPDQWSYAVDLLRKNGFSGAVAEAAGIASKRSGGGHVDMFRGRLMFPIHNMRNQAISMGGRVIPVIADRHGDKVGGKYINGRETKLFRKSSELYGMNLARDAIRREGEALVMEGYTDVIAARQSGLESAVAVLGTALGTQHIKILSRFIDRVVLVLDGDTAGQRRADEVLELFVGADVDLRIMTLPDGSDPADYLADNGLDAFRKLAKDAPDALDHKLNKLTSGVDVMHDTHAVTKAIDTMLKIAAKGASGHSIKIDQMLLRMARSFNTTREQLQERLKVLRSSAQSKKRYQAPVVHQQHQHGADPNAMLAQSVDDPMMQSPAGAPVQQQQAQAIVGIDRELFETLIESPSLVAMAVEAVDPSWLKTPTAKMLLDAYQRMEMEGLELGADKLLLFLENEFLKNQVVTFITRVEDSEGRVIGSAEERYGTILARYHERDSKVERSKQIAELQATDLEPEQEDALLQQLIDAERQRRGIKSKGD